jgi:hypothetical protein
MESGKRIAQFIRWPSLYNEESPITLPIAATVPSQFVMGSDQSAGKRNSQFIRWASFQDESSVVFVPIVITTPSQFVMGSDQTVGRRIPQFIRAGGLLSGDSDFIFSTNLPPTVTLGITLFENYFTDLGPTIIVQSDPLSIISVPIVPNSSSGSYQPISIGRQIATFGASVSQPSQITGFFSFVQNFSRTSGIPSDYFRRADDWGALGRLAMGSQLLVAPGNGGLSGHVYYVVAGGSITIPELSSTALWSVVCRLNGNGRNNGILKSDTLVNGSVVQTLYSNQNYYQEPKLQLSLGINYSGSGSSTPMVQLMQFEIQEILYR